MNSVIAYIGLGSNLNQPAEQLRLALEGLAQCPGIIVGGCSSYYTSAPVGEAYQGQPDYVNAVAQIVTSLSAPELLATLLAIELQFGRSRVVANAARTLDLDLLLYGQEEIDMPGLQVPHPRMHERAFVLEPLFEIAPHLEIPVRGAVADLLKMCHHQRLQRLEMA